MLSLFQRKKVPPISSTPAPTEHPKGLVRPERATSLLATPRRQKLLEHIWQRTSLSRSQFATLYRAPLERYAELVQQFPASESHHHAYPGGMLDHGLECVAYALKLRQSHLLPVGASPEAQAGQAEAWTAGTAYAALLHDIGKLAVDLHIEYADGELWHPWHGPLRRPYRFRYRKDRAYRLHSAATGLLYHQILDPAIYDWLSGYPELWAALLYVLAGQYEHAGLLGELVVQADQASVAQELGGDPTKALAAPKQSLQRKLLDGLRYLLKHELKLNQAQASDGWLTQDALWLVSKTVSDKLRAHLLSQGVAGIPASNVAVFDIMQDHAIAQPTPEGKAIWNATVTSDAGWSHSFTLLKLAPSLIWEAADRPAPYGGTVQITTEPASAPPSETAEPAHERSNAVAASPSSTASTPPPSPGAPAADSVDALLELLGTPAAQAPAAPVIALPDDAPLGTTTAPAPAADTANLEAAPFMDWLKHGIQSRKLIINDAKALVHTVADTAYLVSPGVFQRYAQEHPTIRGIAARDNLQDWQWVQKQFERLRLHCKQPDGLNIWTCEVVGPRKSRRLHGYLLESATELFPEVFANNPHLRLLDSPHTKPTAASNSMQTSPIPSVSADGADAT
ncbi:MobH family relaxase [Ralstonia pseudosolanacearum]|uniref:MobH family relaxase n=1 Tax=Ralstonia pseudosolanacearum TaxID=1310165 RepID=UPI0040549573